MCFLIDRLAAVNCVPIRQRAWVRSPRTEGKQINVFPRLGPFSLEDALDLYCTLVLRRTGTGRIQIFTNRIHGRPKSLSKYIAVSTKPLA